MLLPIHIATRGRLDGEYGIATRGYIICPDIVPRFPSRGEVRPLDLFGDVRELDFEGILRALELLGEVDDSPPRC